MRDVASSTRDEVVQGLTAQGRGADAVFDAAVRGPVHAVEPERPSRLPALVAVACFVGLVGLVGLGLAIRSGGDGTVVNQPVAEGAFPDSLGPPPYATPSELAEAMVRSFQAGNQAVVAEMSFPGYVGAEDEIAQLFESVHPPELSNWCYSIEGHFYNAYSITMYADQPSGSFWHSQVPAYLVDDEGWWNGFGYPGESMTSYEPSTSVTGQPVQEEDDLAEAKPANCIEVDAEE